MPPLDLPIDSPWPLTEREAADFLRLSVRTLQAWRLQCKGPPYLSAGRAIRYRYCDLVTWMESRLVVPEAHDQPGATGADFRAPSKVGAQPLEQTSRDCDQQTKDKSAVNAENKAELEEQCQAWLEAEMRESPAASNKTKTEWQAEAQVLWPLLSERSFLMVWNIALKNTRAQWSKPGPKPKSPHR